MIIPVPDRASCIPDPGARRLAATLYAYTFFDDFVLLYPVYVLLFAHTGLSVAQISSLFIIWSVTGFTLEIPAGVWADAVSRRLLLAAGPLLSAAGFALWIAVPSYWAFAAGFVLWGAEGALQSGAMEALVYEELDRFGASGRYAKIMGRAHATGVCAVMVATALAGPVLAAGGYLAVGVASVLARLACAAIAAAFPERRSTDWPDEVSAEPASCCGAEAGPAGLGYLQALRSGLHEARTDRPVLHALLLVPAVTAVWGALEEYYPLLAQSTGVAARTVPLLVLLISAGVTAGGLLAAAGQQMSRTTFAMILAFGGLALAAGALSGRPAGFILVAAAFCVFQLASVVADARLQARITGPSRATVTSLAGVGTELATVLVFGIYAAASSSGRHAVIFAFFAVPYLAVAAVLAYSARNRTRREHLRDPIPGRSRSLKYRATGRGVGPIASDGSERPA
jgi:MFS family permease